MKKPVLVWLTALVTLSLAAPGAALGVQYGAPVSIGSNATDLIWPVLNNLGHVAWQAFDGHDYEIFFYRQGTISQITDNDTDDVTPYLNDLDQIAWTYHDGQDQEIRLWSAGSIVQITNNSESDNNPCLNNQGHLVWNHGYGNSAEIYFYDGLTSSPISANEWAEGPPCLNDNDQVVWSAGADLAHHEIYWYDSGFTTQISDNPYGNWFPRLNNQGQVVWMGFDAAYDLEIFLWQQGGTSQLTVNDHNDWYPQINQQGWIVWDREDGQDREIWLYANGAATPLTANSYDDLGGYLNNSGQIAWTGFDGTLYHLYLADPVYEATSISILGKGKVYVGLTFISPTVSWQAGFLLDDPSAFSIYQVSITDRSLSGESYLFTYVHAGGQVMVGAGYCDYNARSGYFAGFPVDQPEAKFIGAYSWVEGDTYQYFLQYSSGEIVAGQGMAGQPGGYVYGVPLAAPAAYFVTGYQFQDTLSQVALPLGHYWGGVIWTCLLDCQYD
jgi:hypothetical protein